jgi:hypothetical protein
MAIRLAANYISATESIGGNWGHLQLVRPDGQQEIEVQNWLSLSTPPTEVLSFSYRPAQNHSANTDYAPGNANPDPDRYGIVNIEIGGRDETEVWRLLQDVNTAFVRDTPGYLYGLGQNSNSYAATLLWMTGIDVGSLLAAVRPADVTGMDPTATKDTDSPAVLHWLN